MIEDAHDSRYETNVDYSFFTEPVSCEVHNKVGSTNVSTLVNVHCESLRGQGQRWYSHWEQAEGGSTEPEVVRDGEWRREGKKMEEKGSGN